MICASSELSRLELSYVAAYQALRHGFGEQERGALFREAQASTARMTRDCNLPTTGARPGTTQEVACLRALYLEFIADLRRRAGPEALEEARMPPEHLIELQTALKARGLLPADAVADGVLGPQTRAAIVAWQQASAVRANGFASPAMLSRIAPPSIAGAPPGIATLPSAPASPPASVAPPAPPSPTGRAPSEAAGTHPVLPLHTQLPPLDLRLCRTRAAAEAQARAPSNTAAADPRSLCEHRPAAVELVKPEPAIAPYRAWIAQPTPGGTRKLGLLYEGEALAVGYDWGPGEVRVWQVRVLERDGTIESMFAEVPERPLEISFLQERGAWPPKSGQKTTLQVCPAGPSTWLEDKRTSCKVWNPCPQRGETVEWSGRCEGGLAEGPGTLIWRYAGVEQRYDSELKGGKSLERPESFTDSKGCRIANWLRAAAGTTFTWTGPCVDGVAQGDGKLEWSGSGTTSGSYAGRLVESRPDGYGVVTFVTGISYEGRFARGLRDGKGRMTYLNGNRYDGDWREGKRSGRGILTAKDGARYDGEWRDDKRTGRGVLVLNDGTRYDGEWREDLINGRGTYIFADGARYDGDWRDGKRTGRGVLTWKNGDRYDGDFRDDARTGSGVYTWSNGNRYEGAWLDGKRQGRGTLTAANGATYDGEWQDDNRNGFGTQVNSSGGRYEGEWRNDFPDGFGTGVIQGDTYTGIWSSGCIRNASGRASFGKLLSECP